MTTRYVARYTRLHPALWAPYRITAYPNGFHEWPGDLALPVWTPTARTINRARACLRELGDHHTIDDALDACWTHFATLPNPVSATAGRAP